MWISEGRRGLNVATGLERGLRGLTLTITTLANPVFLEVKLDAPAKHHQRISSSNLDHQ